LVSHITRKTDGEQCAEGSTDPKGGGENWQENEEKHIMRGFKIHTFQEILLR
jgi:hypothetical protein